MAYVNIKREPKAEKEIEVAIRDRLLNGFANWNGGYDAWLEWCNTLYEPDAHYNVYGKRMTLQEYKDMMGLLFKKYTMELGDFENMFIQDNWCAIRYSVTIKDLKSGKEYPQQRITVVQLVHYLNRHGCNVVWEEMNMATAQKNAEKQAPETKEVQEKEVHSSKMVKAKFKTVICASYGTFQPHQVAEVPEDIFKDLEKAGLVEKAS